MFRSRNSGEFYQGEHHGYMTRRNQTRINGVHDILSGLQQSNMLRTDEVEPVMGCQEDFEQLLVTDVVHGVGQVGLIVNVRVFADVAA